MSNCEEFTTYSVVARKMADLSKERKEREKKAESMGWMVSVDFDSSV